MNDNHDSLVQSVHIRVEVPAHSDEHSHAADIVFGSVSGCEKAWIDRLLLLARLK